MNTAFQDFLNAGSLLDECRSEKSLNFLGDIHSEFNIVKYSLEHLEKESIELKSTSSLDVIYTIIRAVAKTELAISRYNALVKNAPEMNLVKRCDMQQVVRPYLQRYDFCRLKILEVIPELLQCPMTEDIIKLIKDFRNLVTLGESHHCKYLRDSVTEKMSFSNIYLEDVYANMAKAEDCKCTIIGDCVDSIKALYKCNTFLKNAYYILNKNEIDNISEELLKFSLNKNEIDNISEELLKFSLAESYEHYLDKLSNDIISCKVAVLTRIERYIEENLTLKAEREEVIFILSAYKSIIENL